jgi:NAD(P)-dependent dehydrogenase (short-subunit alcohol dehydrogenase family)
MPRAANEVPRASYVALVTGAGGGIGLATVRAFAESGASVIVADRDAALIETAADELRSAGQQALTVTCDVMDRSQVRAMIEEAVRTYGRLDAAFDNAGVNCDALCVPASSRPLTVGEDTVHARNANAAGPGYRFLRCALRRETANIVRLGARRWRPTLVFARGRGHGDGFALPFERPEAIAPSRSRSGPASRIEFQPVTLFGRRQKPHR